MNGLRNPSAYATCPLMHVTPVERKTVPSFLKQTEWPCGYISIPNEPCVRWFNPSICNYRGNLLFAVRRSFSNQPPVGINTICMFTLDVNRKEARNKQVVNFNRTYLNEHFEDPRLSVLSDEVYISCTNFVVKPYKAHQILGRWLGPTHHVLHANICYGNNGITMFQNVGNEKNWTWFQPNGDWHLLYMPWPQHIVKAHLGVPSEKYVAPASECPWSMNAYGLMRGGSPPVLLGKYYYVFFHSAVIEQEQPKRIRRYYMGCYVFDKDPPFRQRAITTHPLLVGSEEDGGTLPVIFPGGAVYIPGPKESKGRWKGRDGKWLIVFGVNDYRSGWIEIPHKDLKERLMTHIFPVPVTSKAEYVRIDNNPIKPIRVHIPTASHYDI